MFIFTTRNTPHSDGHSDGRHFRRFLLTKFQRVSDEIPTKLISLEISDKISTDILTVKNSDDLPTEIFRRPY